jgi:hypothetical protein
MHRFLLGVIVPQRQNTREPGMSIAQTASDHQDMGPMSVEGIEPKLQALTGEAFPSTWTPRGVMTFCL